MSDTWNQIQDFKNKQLSLREKLKRRKAEREGLVADLLEGGAGGTRLDSPGAPSTPVGALGSIDAKNGTTPTGSPAPSSTGVVAAAATSEKLSSPSLVSSASTWDPEVEANLYVILCDVRIPAPTKHLRHAIVSLMTEKKAVSLDAVDELLQKLAADNLVSLEPTPEEEDAATCGKFRVVGTEQSKVVAMATHIVGEEKLEKLRKRKRVSEEEDDDGAAREPTAANSSAEKPPTKKSKRDGDERESSGRGGGSGGGSGGSGKSGMKSSDEDSLDFLLSATSTKEKEKKEQSEDILYLLSKPTAKEQSLSEKFRSAGGSNIKDFCDYVTKDECRRQRKDGKLCHRYGITL